MSEHRKPPLLDPPWGECRWCGDEILKDGERYNRRRWHEECIRIYLLATQRDVQLAYFRERGRLYCAECGPVGPSAVSGVRNRWNAIERVRYTDSPFRDEWDRYEMWEAIYGTEPRYGTPEWDRRYRWVPVWDHVAVLLAESLGRPGHTWTGSALPWKPGDPYLEVDHVVPLIDGGSFSVANLQLLCREHHARKTAREAGRRARRRREAAAGQMALG